MCKDMQEQLNRIEAQNAEILAIMNQIGALANSFAPMISANPMFKSFLPK